MGSSGGFRKLGEANKTVLEEDSDGATRELGSSEELRELIGNVKLSGLMVYADDSGS